MTLKQIIQEKEKNLNKIPDKLLTQIQKSERDIYARIVSLIGQLKQDSDGKIFFTGVAGKKNQAIAANITNELKTVLTDKEYLNALKEFVGGMDAQAVANDKYFAKVFKGFKTSPTADALLERAKTAALNQLLGAPVEASFITPVSEIIDTAVSSGSSWVDLSNQIKEFVLGNEEVDGKLMQHANNVAYDSFAFSDRAYTNIIAEDLGTPWRLWSGTEQDNSRCFCVERKGRYFHIDEIRSWGRGENIGACKQGTHWQGADKNTNEDNILIVAGGYKCLDSILPVSIAVVPQADIDRAIELGFYNPAE